MPIKKSEPMTAEELLKWDQLEKGDIIQFDIPERPNAIHHMAIYVGDEPNCHGNIIHLATTEPGFSGTLKNISQSDKNTGVVQRVSLEQYFEQMKISMNNPNYKIGVKNWADDGYEVLDGFLITQRRHVSTTVASPDEIIRRAKYYLANPDKLKRYHFLDNNCEAFATLCRYGEAFSGQSIAFRNTLRLPLVKF